MIKEFINHLHIPGLHFEPGEPKDKSKGKPVPQPNVDAVPQDQVTLSGPASRNRVLGPKTLADRLPVEKGSYRVIMDYVDPSQNHLYLVDKRDGKVAARYVSNGGKQELTRGTEWTIDRLQVRPTWYPTEGEQKCGSYSADGPGPTSSMGLAKLHFYGNEYIHGVWDATVNGTKVAVNTEKLNTLSSAHSYGCWNMSNPNVVELVERFGIDQGAQIRILRKENPADKAEAARLAAELKSEGLADRRLSDGLDLLEADFKGQHKYMQDHPYRTVDGDQQPDDGWYLKLWERRRAAGM